MTEWLDVGIRQRGTGGKTIVRDLNDIADATDRADANLSKLGKNAAIVGGIIGTAIGTAIGGGIVMLYKGFANAAKSIKDTASAAKQLGEGVETMSRLEFAAKQYDITTATLTNSLENLQRVQTQAAKPGKEMHKLFEQMGISATNLDGSLRPTTDVLRDVANLFQKMPDGTNKSALAMKLFGNENRELIKLLNEGAQGLDEMAKKSDELGYTVGDEVAKDVSEFYDQLDNVKIQLEAMYREALPTLLPYMRQFGELLDSQEFKDGFRSLIEGAANAVVWLAKLSSQFVNTITTLAENTAAARHGAALDDAPRVNAELDRIEARIARIQDWQRKGRLGRALSGLGPADSYAQGRNRMLDGAVKPDAELAAATELNILTARRNTLLEAQREIERSQYKAADEAARKREEEMRQFFLDAEKPKPTATGIDWSALGGGGGGKGGKGSTDRSAERELRQLTNSYEQLIKTVDPVLAATMQYEEAQKTLAGAVQRGWLEQDKATEYLDQYGYLLRDQLDPMAAVEREMQKQIDAAKLLGKERDIEVEVLGRLEQLRRDGITLTEEETKRLREQVTVLREVNDLAAAKERILAGSAGKQQEQFALDLSAFMDLKDSLTEGDKFNWLNAALGGSLDETQSALDARLEQLDLYYQFVQQFRDADVAHAKLAADAMNAIEKERMNLYVSQIQSGLAAAAGLMQSHNKTAFKIGQAAAIANTTITGIQMAMNAYESASKIPYVGWILGPLAAAGAAATAAAQISQIRSQQPPAYRTGGEYIVGGTGGVDSQTVAMRATPGERISINTPRQASAMERMAAQLEARAGNDRPLNMNLTVVQTGKPDNKTPVQNARLMRRGAQELMRVKRI